MIVRPTDRDPFRRSGDRKASLVAACAVPTGRIECGRASSRDRV